MVIVCHACLNWNNGFLILIKGVLVNTKGNKIHNYLNTGTIQVIKEYSSYSTRNISMLNIEIIITPFLKLRIVSKVNSKFKIKVRCWRNKDKKSRQYFSMLLYFTQKKEVIILMIYENCILCILWNIFDKKEEFFFSITPYFGAFYFNNFSAYDIYCLVEIRYFFTLLSLHLVEK